MGWRSFQECSVPASGLASQLSSPPPPAAPFGFKITPWGPCRGGAGSTPVLPLLPSIPAAPTAPRRCLYPQNTLAGTPAPRCALGQGGYALVASPCSVLLAGGPGRGGECIHEALAHFVFLWGTRLRDDRVEAPTEQP